MKVIDHILSADKTLFSFEIVPPPRGRTLKDIIDIVQKLSPYSPSWIDVTSHASSISYQTLSNGEIKQKTQKKRPGTLGICGVIQNRFQIDTVAHLLCMGFTKQETEDALIELNYLGLENVLALRGDRPNFDKPKTPDQQTNTFAVDLVTQIKNINQGHYLDPLENAQKLDFCIGVAGYPEKHFESPSLKSDLFYLKQKIDQGAQYIVTQMFFDNQKYFDYVKLCQSQGITVPIIPGLKIIKNKQQLSSLPKSFHLSLPDSLVEQINLASPDEVQNIGLNWAKIQVQELIKNKVPSIHFYVLNDVDLVTKVISEFQ